MARLLGQRSCTAWVGNALKDGQAQTPRAFPSRRQSLLAATGLLDENVLPRNPEIQGFRFYKTRKAQNKSLASFCNGVIDCHSDRPHPERMGPAEHQISL